MSGAISFPGPFPGRGLSLFLLIPPQLSENERVLEVEAAEICRSRGGSSSKLFGKEGKHGQTRKVLIM